MSCFRTPACIQSRSRAAAARVAVVFVAVARLVFAEITRTTLYGLRS